MSAPDIAAALERVREAMPHPTRKDPKLGYWEWSEPTQREIEAGKAALATIKAHITEVEGWHQQAVNKIHLEAGETKVQARRAKAAEDDLLLAAQQNTRLSERLERLEGALREYVRVVREHAEALPADDEDFDDDHAAVVSSLGFIGSLNPGCLDEDDELRQALEIIAAALAEEPYADVPGAGQRGC